MRPDLELSKLIKSMAREAGFDLAGIAQVEDFPELARFPEWIAKGRAGDMKYLEARAPTGELRRAALKTVFPWANSVAVCAINYNTAHPYSTETAQADHGWVSRYAWSREDYHDSVLRRLHEVEARLKTSCGPGLQTRAYVDTGPVVERVYARYAGIGWLGKNTCLINQQVGSWLFLGVIITSLELLPDLPAPDRCGSCTRCIDACPTGAFPAPYELDSTRCIAYLTIEKHGEIPEELRDGIGHHVFGCDICQEVCPWNRRAPVTTKPEFEPREGLFNPALAWLAELTEDAFREKFRRSPLKRARRSGLRRNAIIAIGNAGNPCFLPLLEAAARDEDPVVTDAARWARRRILERD